MHSATRGAGLVTLVLAVRAITTGTAPDNSRGVAFKDRACVPEKEGQRGDQPWGARAGAVGPTKSRKKPARTPPPPQKKSYRSHTYTSTLPGFSAASPSKLMNMAWGASRSSTAFKQAAPPTTVSLRLVVLTPSRQAQLTTPLSLKRKNFCVDSASRKARVHLITGMYLCVCTGVFRHALAC